MTYLRHSGLLLSLALLAVVVGTAILVCEQGGLAQPATPSQVSGTPVSFTVIGERTQSTVTERTNYLITSQSQLNQLWKMLDASGAAPTVDFSADDVIAVFAGQEPTAGYAIAVSSIEDAALRMVTITTTKPGGSCILAEMLTSPYQVVEMPKTTLELTHQDAVKTTSCID